MANEVQIEITADEKKALAALKKMTAAVDRFEKTTKKSSKKVDGHFRQLNKGIAVFKGNLAAIGVTKVFDLLSSGIRKTVEAAREMETIETQLKVILGSAEDAAQVMRELQEFAANTPFEIQGIANSAKQLLAFGVSQRQVIPILQQLGDAAAGSGQRIEDLTIPYGRLISTQKLTLIELDKFQDRGIPIFNELKRVSGISLGEMRKAITNGKLSFQDFQKALNNLTGEGGTFFNAMTERSKTLDGVISNLDDSLTNMAAAIGKKLSPVLISMATTISDTADAIKGVFDDGLNPVQKITAEIKVLSADLKKAERDAKLFRNAFSKDKTAAVVKGIRDEIAALQDKRREIAFAQSDKNAKTGGNNVATQTEAEIEAEKRKLAAIAKIKDDARVAEQEKTALVLVRRDEENITELEKLTEQYGAKAALEIVHQTQLTEIQLGAEAAKLKRQQLIDKAEVEKDKKTLENKKKMALLEKDLNLKTAQASINVAQNAANLLTAIAGKETAASFILGKVAAVGQVLLADSQARAAATAASAAASIAAGPGALAAFGANMSSYMGIITANTALSLGTIAAQSLQGFAGGGIIGQSMGATSGMDNRLATVRDGEMILNASDQRNVFNAISSGSIGGGGDSMALLNSINQGISALLAKDNVIEIDGRELGRSIRDISTGRGFVLA